MGNKSFEYRQLTIRLPFKVYRIIERYAGERGLTLQDAILVMLLDYLGLVEPGGGE